MPDYIANTFAIACALAVTYLLMTWSNRLHPHPPGPKGLPLIGHIFHMPGIEDWEVARQWGETYGPVVYIENLGIPCIFLNSYQAAVDLLEKRGNIYSSRPGYSGPMIELEGWSWLMLMMPYGDELRKARQLMHRFFQPAAVGDYKEVQTISTHRMLEGLLNKPDQFPTLLRHSAGESILMVSYGYQVLEENDPYVALAEKGIATIGETTNYFLLGLFPMLQNLPSWFPGTGFKEVARKGYLVSMAMYQDAFQMAKAQFTEGTARPSVTSKLLDAHLSGDPAITDETLIPKVAGVAYAAGADTTVSALITFFLAMLLHPDIQKRAQDELDRVVGRDTLPSFMDRPNLPYLEAIIKETFRWQAVAPFSFPHVVDEDNVYKGHLIPSGSVVIPNIWAMLRDAKEYPEPDKFLPERWLPADGKGLPLDPRKIIFGIGRRICPGRHFAVNHVFIGAASILAAFNITKAFDANGEPITPKVDYTPTFIRQARTFEYVLTPRSDKIPRLIRLSVEATK